MACTCERVRAQLSAYVDQTLPPRRLEQLSYHLAGCEECRAEMTSLCAVRNKLSACRDSRTPSDLTSRLEQIAGDHADAPLYLASGPGRLPTSRERRNRRVAQSCVALLGVAMALVVIAALVAPSPVRISDPVTAAREQFSSAASAVGVNEAVGAVLLAHEKGADLGASVSYDARGAELDGTELPAEQAAAMLQRAVEAQVAISGVQRVWVADGEGHYRHADVKVAKQPGEGALLRVFDSQGDEFAATFLPASLGTEFSSPVDWSFVQAPSSEDIDGRAAIHLTAVTNGYAVASWWFDEATGILLWSERYDTAGATTLAVGFTSLTLGEADFDGETATVSSLEPASSSGEAGWCIGLPSCPQKLAGLPLVAYSSTTKSQGKAMILVYSDGFQTMVVGWCHGRLNQTRIEEVSTTTASVRVWQHNDEVVTVATNGDLALLREAASHLPAEAAYRSKLLDRVADGLRRLGSGS